MGKVLLIGVPIGNYKDITLRALEALKDVALILCEDTRETSLLLTNFMINTSLSSYVGSYEGSLRKALDLLKAGKDVGVVSDRGMPTISDPGADLLEYFRSKNIKVDVVPGVSAVTTAFSLTGLNGGFNFLGFLSRKKAAIESELRVALVSNHTMFFESPNRIKKTLGVISGFYTKKIFILRELTKTYQEVLCDTPKALMEKEIKGELVIILPKLD